MAAVIAEYDLTDVDQEYLNSAAGQVRVDAEELRAGALGEARRATFFGDDLLIENGLTWRVEGCLLSGRRARG